MAVCNFASSNLLVLSWQAAWQSWNKLLHSIMPVTQISLFSTAASEPESSKPAAKTADIGPKVQQFNLPCRREVKARTGGNKNILMWNCLHNDPKDRLLVDCVAWHTSALELPAWTVVVRLIRL